MRADVGLLAICFLICRVKGVVNDRSGGILQRGIDGFSLSQPGFINITLMKYSAIVKCLPKGKALTNINPELRFNDTITVESVNITSCEVPANVSYAEILSSFNFNASVLKKLILTFGDIKPSILEAIHFTGLEIEELDLINEKSRLTLELSADALSPLMKLKNLLVDRVSLREIPDTIKLNKIELNRGRYLSNFGQCSELETLYINDWYLSIDISSYNCSNIWRLKLESVSLWTVTELLRISYESLRDLTIHDCALVQMKFTPEILPIKKLEKLDLSHNGLSALILFRLSDREFMESEKDLSAYAMPNLQELSLAHNPIYNFCNSADRYIIGISNLRKLSLANTALEGLCFSRIQIPALEYLNLTHNDIMVVKIFELIPYSYAEHVVIDLQHNPIQEVLFADDNHRYMYEESVNFDLDQNITDLWNRTTILLNRKLDCDCKHGWFGRMLRNRLISVEGAKCFDGRDLVQVSRELLECEKDEEDGCTFRTQWGRSGIVANCSGGNLKTLPRRDNLERIYASENDIRMIRPEDLPDTLKFLDLRKNRIARFDENVSRLFFEKGRKFLLGDNEILCDCDNSFFIEQLQAHHSQVEDYYNLTCANIQRAVKDVIPNDLCPMNMLPLILSVSIVIAFAMICVILYRIYGQDLKIFLFAHGWCLYFVSEEDVDSDRCYDAFVSFSHHDHDFIVDKLLTVLEPEYKICVHYRDWIVGEWIPTQVQNSVEVSKRTIIVLSNNYLDSMWGMFEFRISYSSALKEGRSRVIIIVIDDVLDSTADMDPDLRHFVMNNTYLKWGDPWFWQKLRYTLPHKSLGKDGLASLKLDDT